MPCISDSLIDLSREEKLKEVMERLQEIAKKQKDIDERMKRVEKLMDSKKPEDE
jgi:DNA repair exonuclease SbcCD ATPase subunit